MNTSELSASLQALGVAHDAYSIGLDRDETYCLIHEQGLWKVYYSERGNRNDERAFTQEPPACRDLLDRLIRDGIVRSQIQG